MSNNTRRRSIELATLAADIAAREQLTELPAKNGRYVAELAQRGGISKVSARRVWYRRFRPAQNGWGGKRQNAGRKSDKS